MQFFAEYGMFLLKTLTLIIAILIILLGIILITSKSKGQKDKAQLEIKNINEKYDEMKATLQAEILSKNELKLLAKEQKEKKKAKKDAKKRIFVLDFCGDMKASAVNTLRDEVSAILSIATPKDEVVMCLESPGGTVIGYGLGASQLQRIREKKIPLTVLVDKVAASGGYLMACVANQIIAAPFAIIGSIGVLAQLPNFHRFLKKKDIDVEQITAGKYKRTVTMFGENTEKDREKMKSELEAIHLQFKNFITEHRPMVDIAQVATGEYWLAHYALQYKLIDSLMTSDDYLFSASQNADIYHIRYVTKKSLSEKVAANIQMFFYKLLNI